MPQIQTEIEEIIIVFDAFCVQFPREIVIRFNTDNNEKTSYAVPFLKRTLQRFASKLP